ncbi:MAG: hypothetical protein R3B47_02780 [Bacteroidia bacterium]
MNMFLHEMDNAHIEWGTHSTAQGCWKTMRLCA